MEKLRGNKSNAILQAAEHGKYGVLAIVCYNLEAVVAVVKAAEAKRSPAMILLFPWAIHYASALLVNLAADACHRASVPLSLHLDHAQDEDIIKYAASLPFDSIMVDMSHYGKAENLARTAELVRCCHERGIACEAEPGRIEGGEDGIKDTADLDGLLTTPEEALQFVDTGIDFLAPAFGNVHGDYGPRGIQLEYDRLDSIHKVVHERQIRLVLHGTDGFSEEILKRCIGHGITKININSLIRQKFSEVVRDRIGKAPLTQVMGEATSAMQALIEDQMDQCGSSGKA